MSDHRDPHERRGVDWWRQMSRSWTPPDTLRGQLTAGVARMVDLFGFSPGAVLQDLVDTVASHLVGREIEIKFGDANVQLTVTRVDAAPAPAGSVVGQLGSVEVDARDVRWADHQVDDLAIEARNVHISAGNPHSIVAAPVLFRASFTETTIAAAVAKAQRRVSVKLRGDSGGTSVMLRGREEWGHVDVEPRVDGSTLELRPTGIALWHGRSRGRWLNRLPAIRRRLQLPAGMVLDDLTVDDRRVIVRGALREWREPVSATQLEEVVTRLRSLAGRELHLPRHTV